MSDHLTRVKQAWEMHEIPAFEDIAALCDELELHRAFVAAYDLSETVFNGRHCAEIPVQAAANVRATRQAIREAACKTT